MKRLILLFVLITPCFAELPPEGYYNSLGYRGSEWSIDKGTHTRIICLGDSVTEGGDKEQSYPEILQEMLGNDYQVLNAGVGGNNAEECMYRLDALLNYKPDFVVTMFGINDISQENQFIYRIKCGAINRFIQRPKELKEFRPLTFETQLLKLNEISKSVKVLFVIEGYVAYKDTIPDCFHNEDEYVQAYYIYSHMIGTMIPNHVIPPLDATDFVDRVHPNYKGNKKIAETVAKYIR